MHPVMLDTLLNLAVLPFWYAAWAPADGADLLNPFLGPFSRASARAVDFLRPVLFFLPPRLIAAVAAAFLIVFRAFLFNALPASGGPGWILVFGFEACAAAPGRLLPNLAFSLLSFAMFLFKLWGFSLLYVGARPRASSDDVRGTLCGLCEPFCGLRPALRPPLLLAFGVLLAALLSASATPVAVFPVLESAARAPSALAAALRFAISTLAAWVGVLAVLRSLVLLLIIGSWVALFSSTGPLMFLCQEGLAMLLGPLRRYPLRVGVVDLTPLILVLAIQFLVYPGLMTVLLASYSRLP